MYICKASAVSRLSDVAALQTPAEQLSILVVDSDVTGVSRARRWIEADGRVFLGYAANDRAAADMLKERSWDLIVIDPAGCGGFELIRQAKALDRWLAALVVTHDRSPAFVERAVQSRIEGLIFKPVLRTPFMQQVLQLAEASREQRRRRQKRVLAIGAHPDDVEIGCGGALAKHRADGDLLHILTLSLGSAGGDANVRLREALQAAKLLDATIEFGDLRDTHISEGTETIDLIQAAIRNFRPTHVYTHSLEDTHQDHRAAHMATLTAARGVPNVYCYQTPSSTVEFRPNRFVDISKFIEAKLCAIGAHKSQVDRSASLGEDVIVSTARYWGRYAGYVMAEPIEIVRQRAGAAAPEIYSGVGMGSIDWQGAGRPSSTAVVASLSGAA